MRRDDAVRGLIVAVALIVAGATWLYGAWAMVAAGVILLAILLVLPMRED